MIVVPLIFINSFSSAIGAVSLMPMPAVASLALTIATTVLNLFAAVLVAVQKVSKAGSSSGYRCWHVVTWGILCRCEMRNSMNMEA